MANKQVIFACPRYPALVLVMKPMGLKDLQGNKIPSVRLMFQPDPKLGAGILRLDEPKHIKFVRDSEYYKNKLIIEVNEESELPVKAAAPKVQTGILDSADVKLPSGEPKEAMQPVKAARVGRRI